VIDARGDPLLALGLRDLDGLGDLDTDAEQLPLAAVEVKADRALRDAPLVERGEPDAADPAGRPLRHERLVDGGDLEELPVRRVEVEHRVDERFLADDLLEARRRTLVDLLDLCASLADRDQDALGRGAKI